MGSVVAELRAFMSAALVNPVEREQRDTAAQWRRRQVVIAITTLVGAIALGAALTIPPGDPRFYAATLGIAGIWAIGAFASGRLHLGRATTRRGPATGRGVLQGILLGGLLLAVFLVGALVVAQIPPLREPVLGLLDHAVVGSLVVVAVVTALNGVAEELFFRGAVYAAFPRRWNLLGSTALYALSTAFSGVLLLTFAALCLGLLTGAQRRVTGGVAGPIASHLTWSLGMLFLLPPLMGALT